MPLPLRFCAHARGVDSSFAGDPSRRPSLYLFLLCLALAALSAACGAVGSSAPPPQAASVSVQPNSAQVFLGGKTHFTALVQNASNSSVTWTPSPNVGTIDASGDYIAPDAGPVPASITVTATLQSDPTVTGSAVVSIQSSLAISPARAGVTTTQTLPLKVVTQGVGGANVSWSVDGVVNGNSGVGVISATTSGAIYAPPSTPGAHAIAAILNANPNVMGQASVYVTDFAGTFTWRNDNARSGVNSHEWALSPANVNSSTFGKLFSCPVDGYVYAQPLYVANLTIPGNGTHNVVFVATENDSVYAFDADTNTNPCTPLWQASLVPTGEQAIQVPSNQIGTTLLGPLIGVTGTPVIDPGPPSPSLYVMAATLMEPPQGSPLGTPSTYWNRLYQLDLATGEFRANGSPLEFTVAGFSPVTQLQRAALLLDNGNVYVAFGSDSFDSTGAGSNGPAAASGAYHGWLFEFDSTSLAPTEDFNVTTNSFDGGIWQSGGGPSADANHNVFVTTGDGPPNSSASYSDSVVRLNTDSGLSAWDYFTPCDQGAGWYNHQNTVLESQSSAPLLLPPSQPPLLISGTKEGFLYVINRDNMGKFPTINCSDSPRAQVIDVGGPLFSTPVYWNNCLYVAPGQDSHLMALSLPQSVIPCKAASPSTETLGPQGATSVISTDGASNAVLWLIDTCGTFATTSCASPAILRAYDANDLSKELYDSAQNAHDAAGSAVKFTVPTVANSKVYVGTQTELDVYGLLP